MEYVRRSWIGLLVMLVAAFYVTLAAVWAFDPEQTTGEKLVGLALTLIPAGLLLGGLWLARDRRASAARVAIAIGVLPTLVFWWMILPVLAAAAVMWFGIVKGRLTSLPA